jgi:hypothetical protein
MGGSAKGIPRSEGEERSGLNDLERTMTSEKFEVRGLKYFSYERRVSELHAWLSISLRMAPSQKSGQEKQVEKEGEHVSKVCVFFSSMAGTH